MITRAFYIGEGGRFQREPKLSHIAIYGRNMVNLGEVFLYGIYEGWWSMEPSNQYYIGQSIILTTLDNSTSFSCRIVNISEYVIDISVPYHQGKMIIWPVGTKLKAAIADKQGESVFQTEILGRTFEGTRSYTIMMPHTISRANTGTREKAKTRVIAVTSGKGGVGKTTLVINLAIALANLGKRVYILDLDLGTADVDVLLSIKSRYNIVDLFNGDKNLLDIAVAAPGNIFVIPGSSGMQELTQLKDRQFAQVISTFNQLDGVSDIILIDTGAGISKDVSNFLLASDEVIVVTTPEPHAMMDAYAIMKVMHSNNCSAKQMLLVNRAESDVDGNLVAERLLAVVNHYLKKDVRYLGHVLDDKAVSRSVRDQNPLMLSQPDSKSAENIRRIAAFLISKPYEEAAAGITGFITKLYWSFKENKKKLGL